MSKERVPNHDHSGFNEGGKLALNRILSVDEAGAVSGSGGGTTSTASLIVEEDAVVVVSTASVLNATHGLDVTDSGGGVAALAVDETELTASLIPHNALGNEFGQDDFYAIPSMGTAVTIDPTNGNVQKGTLTANCTVTLAAPSGSGAATGELWIIEDSTGGWTISFTGSVTEIGSHDTTAGTTQRAIAESIDGGGTWLWTWVGNSLAFDATVPAAIGTAATGSAATVPHRDHVHPTGAGTPSTQAFGDAATTGSGPAAAMTNHKHAMPAAAITSSGLTQATGKLLGRTTASTGAIEEITVGTNLTFSGGTLAATGGTSATDANIWRPLMDGGGNVVTDGSGQAVMAYSPA